jgi:type III secretion protein V
MLLAAMVLAVVGMMVVPLPTALIDLLIASNLTLGVLLLSAALYVREPLQFAAFPTILLLSTLYRLALNVSSTRLILLQADAGRVIDAFGRFVVRGEYLVGAMVFAILTLIQFIVIARGAERVAEVGARFSLDALPGKQLAIDAELRAGNISAESARGLRKRLERESQLYGALDGAMKFVKGDAIAGIVITLVNLVGGVTLGVVRHGLELEASLATYGLLTIGDGLVTQIPALLGATAAGLVVTRVAAEDHETSLGADIASQLFADRRVLGVGAGVLGLLALIPGLPAWPFGAAAGVLGLLLWRLPARAERTPPIVGELAGSRELLTLAVSPVLAERLTQRGRPGPELQAALQSVREQLTRELGVHVPEPTLRAAAELPPQAYRWSWRELPQPAREVDARSPATAIAASLTQLVRQHADDCVGLEEVQRMLDHLEREQPALVRHTVPRPVSPSMLAQVLRGLVREGVSVRWLPEVLEALSQAPSSETQPPELIERARRALARRISSALAPQGRLHLLRLSALVEESLQDGLRRTEQEEWLALPPELAREIVDAVQAAQAQAPGPCALLTQALLRRHVRLLLAPSCPDLRVICPEELDPALVLTHGEPIGP